MDEVCELAHDSRSQKIPVQAQLLSVNLKLGCKKILSHGSRISSVGSALDCRAKGRGYNSFLRPDQSSVS